MSKLVPRFAIPSSTYTVQLRPLVTDKDSRVAGLQHWAVCLWLSENDRLYEIAAVSGFYFDEAESRVKQPTARMLHEIHELLTRSSDAWAKMPKDQRRDLQPQHSRWLADEPRLSAFNDAMSEMIEAAPQQADRDEAAASEPETAPAETPLVV